MMTVEQLKAELELVKAGGNMSRSAMAKIMNTDLARIKGSFSTTDYKGYQVSMVQDPGVEFWYFEVRDRNVKVDEYSLFCIHTSETIYNDLEDAGSHMKRYVDRMDTFTKLGLEQLL